MKDKKKVLLVNGSRTPIGSFGRSLKSVTVDKLAQHAMVQALRRSGVAPNQVDSVILGHAFQSSLTPNLARFAWDKAGLPVHVDAHTVQIQCGSGMLAIDQGVDKIVLGQSDIVVAGGAESMSTIPYLVPGALRFTGMLSRWFKFGPRPFAGLADDGLVPRALLWDTRTTFMAATAQRLANAYGISRQAQDEYALRSQQLAAAALKSGRFDLEVDPILVGSRGYFLKDEHPRGTSAEKLAALSGVLKQKDITAGNSSGINDGACAVVLASEEAVALLGLSPLVEVVDHAVAGVDPEEMGLGPVLAIRKLLAKTGLSLADIGLFEINEAFAAQYLACEKLLGLDRSIVNVNGGAIALGHPIAMSGARITLSLAHEMKLRGVKYGVASLCIGGGQGIATLLKLVD